MLPLEGGGLIGLLEFSGVDNLQPSLALDRAKCEVEARLREYYAGLMRADFLKLPVMAAYERYYCR